MFSIIRHQGIQVETIIRYHCIPIRMASSKQTYTKCYGALKPESTAAGCTAALENSLALSLKSEHQSTQLPNIPICFYSKLKCMCVCTKEGTRMFLAALCSCQKHPGVHYHKMDKWWYIPRFIGWISIWQWEWMCHLYMQGHEWIS